VRHRVRYFRPLTLSTATYEKPITVVSTAIDAAITATAAAFAHATLSAVALCSTYLYYILYFSC
jgi:hypothetical protein